MEAEGGRWLLGPVATADLADWARQGRVAPTHQLSADGREWSPAFDLAELDMVWMLEMGGGESYGPFNILALGELVQEGTISVKARLTHRLTGQATTVEAQQSAASATPAPAKPSEDAEKFKRDLELQQREATERVGP